METELSVVMPAHNEAAAVGNAVGDIVKELARFDKGWEIIVVDDGSDDGTAAIVKAMADADERIKVVSHSVNRGRGRALRTGISLSSGRYVVTIEADGSWGPRIVLELHEAITREALDVVVASPYHKDGAMLNVPLRRQLPSRIGNVILGVANAGRLTTMSGMTRAYRGEIIRGLCLREDGKEIHLEILARAFAENCRIGEIPATVKWSDERGTTGRGRIRPGKFLRLIVSHLFYCFSAAPLLLFGPLAVLCMILGGGIGLYLAFLFFVLSETVGDRVVLIMTSVFLIITGLQFFTICFLAYQSKNTQTRLYQIQNSIFRVQKSLTNGEAK